MIRFFPIFLTMLLCSCVVTTGVSTGVLPYKDSAYTVTVENIQPTKAKKRAYDEAMKYCSQNGKKFKYIDSLGEGKENFTLCFECN